jgi:hypothetical protein
MDALRRTAFAHRQDNGGTDEPAIIPNFSKTRPSTGEIRDRVRYP